MPIYPSLEDMKVDQYAQAQARQAGPPTASCCPPAPFMMQQAGATAVTTSTARVALYPSLNEYMGLDISVYHPPSSGSGSGALVSTTDRSLVAPVTGSNAGALGLVRAEIKPGIRQVVLCKDGNGKMGLVVRGINKGAFIAFVSKNSPAALAGLRFGDQILEINDQIVAGWDTDKLMNVLKRASCERITLSIRDRPFERTITMQKDSHNHIGFEFRDGQIMNLVKDSSAARNGVLIEHNLIEVNGQNVVGLKDKDIVEIVKQAPRTTTITVMPSFIYSHMIKCIGSGLIRKSMDHSVPEI